jgi:hypothetical protein
VGTADQFDRQGVDKQIPRTVLLAVAKAQRPWNVMGRPRIGNGLDQAIQPRWDIGQSCCETLVSYEPLFLLTSLVARG